MAVYIILIGVLNLMLGIAVACWFERRQQGPLWCQPAVKLGGPLQRKNVVDARDKRYALPTETSCLGDKSSSRLENDPVRTAISVDGQIPKSVKSTDKPNQAYPVPVLEVPTSQTAPVTALSGAQDVSEDENGNPFVNSDSTVDGVSPADLPPASVEACQSLENLPDVGSVLNAALQDEEGILFGQESHAECFGDDELAVFLEDDPCEVPNELEVLLVGDDEHILSYEPAAGDDRAAASHLAEANVLEKSVDEEPLSKGLKAVTTTDSATNTDVDPNDRNLLEVFGADEGDENEPTDCVFQDDWVTALGDGVPVVDETMPPGCVPTASEKASFSEDRGEYDEIEFMDEGADVTFVDDEVSAVAELEGIITALGEACALVKTPDEATAQDAATGLGDVWEDEMTLDEDVCDALLHGDRSFSSDGDLNTGAQEPLDPEDIGMAFSEGLRQEYAENLERLKTYLLGFEKRREESIRELDELWGEYVKAFDKTISSWIKLQSSSVFEMEEIVEEFGNVGSEIKLVKQTSQELTVQLGSLSFALTYVVLNPGERLNGEMFSGQCERILKLINERLDLIDVANEKRTHNNS